MTDKTQNNFHLITEHSDSVKYSLNKQESIIQISITFFFQAIQRKIIWNNPKL